MSPLSTWNKCSGYPGSRSYLKPVTTVEPLKDANIRAKENIVHGMINKLYARAVCDVESPTPFLHICISSSLQFMLIPPTFPHRLKEQMVEESVWLLDEETGQPVEVPVLGAQMEKTPTTIGIPVAPDGVELERGRGYNSEVGQKSS